MPALKPARAMWILFQGGCNDTTDVIEESSAARLSSMFARSLRIRTPPVLSRHRAFRAMYRLQCSTPCHIRRDRTHAHQDTGIWQGPTSVRATPRYDTVCSCLYTGGDRRWENSRQPALLLLCPELVSCHLRLVRSLANRAEKYETCEARLHQYAWPPVQERSSRDRLCDVRPDHRMIRYPPYPQ